MFILPVEFILSFTFLVNKNYCFLISFSKTLVLVLFKCTILSPKLSPFLPWLFCFILHFWTISQMSGFSPLVSLLIFSYPIDFSANLSLFICLECLKISDLPISSLFSSPVMTSLFCKNLFSSHWNVGK